MKTGNCITNGSARRETRIFDRCHALVLSCHFGALGLTAIVTLLLAQTFSATAVGFRPTVETKAVSTNAFKCGYYQFTNAAPPQVRRYLKQTTHTETTSTASGDVGLGANCSTDSTNASATITNFSSSTIEEIATTDKYSCVSTNVYSGDSYTMSQFDDNRHVNCYNDSPCHDEWWYVHDFTSDTASIQYVELDSQLQWAWVNQHDTDYASDGYNYCSGYPVRLYGTNQTSLTGTNFLYYPPTLGGLTEETLTHRKYVVDPPPAGGSDVTTMDLEDEFTTDDLMGIVHGRLPAYSDWEAVSAEGPVMAWKLADCTEQEGTEAKARYKVWFPTKKGKKKSIPYVLKYKMLRASWQFDPNCIMLWKTNITVQRYEVAGTGGIVEMELPELVAEGLDSSLVATKFWVFTTRRGLPSGTQGYDENAPGYGGYGSPPEGWDEFDGDGPPDDDDDDEGDNDEEPPILPPGGGDDGNCQGCSDGSCDTGFGSASLGMQSGAATASFSLAVCLT